MRVTADVDPGSCLYVDKDYTAPTFNSDVTGNDGQDNVEVQFATAGSFTVGIRIDAGTIYTMTVTVIDADLKTSRLGCWKDYMIPRSVAVTPAAKGVPFFVPRKPEPPAVAQMSTSPRSSVSVTTVLLKEHWMWTLAKVSDFQFFLAPLCGREAGV